MNHKGLNLTRNGHSALGNHSAPNPNNANTALLRLQDATMQVLFVEIDSYFVCHHLVRIIVLVYSLQLPAELRLSFPPNLDKGGDGRPLGFSLGSPPGEEVGAPRKNVTCESLQSQVFLLSHLRERHR